MDMLAQAALREVKEGMKQVLASRRFSEQGRRGLCTASQFFLMLRKEGKKGIASKQACERSGP
eukprot:scaffold306727_cov21-Tisochrysis_lutea.AAC.1